MNFTDIAVPEAYKESSDFRFFLKWFGECLTKVQDETENMIDMLDPLRCPRQLLWLLGSTVGFKYDDRLTAAFNRLVILHFASLIRNRGSRTGVTLGAQINMAQFSLLNYAQEEPIMEDRLEDTSVPINSTYVAANHEKGYIDIVYYSDKIPTDACLEYVRPIGMYCFTHAGVRLDSKTRISVDARLTDQNNLAMDIGPTRVGHYRRYDFASMQQMVDNEGNPYVAPRKGRPWFRNSKAEGEPTTLINPGYRSLYSLQLCNNEHIVRSILPEEIFTQGYGPQDVTVEYPEGYSKVPEYPQYNLRYDLKSEEDLNQDVSTIDLDRSKGLMNPRPALGPAMARFGDAIQMSPNNTKFTKVDESGHVSVVDVHPDE